MTPWREAWKENPEERGMYLITVWVEHVKTVDIDLWTGTEWFEYGKSVRAWMPLPEPWSPYNE